MVLSRWARSETSDVQEHVKRLCGYRIEQERRLRGWSQTQLGRRAGLSRDWIRQLESGYPKVRLDDYCACLSIFELSPLTLFMPMLFERRGRQFSPVLLSGDLAALEGEILDFVLGWTIRALAPSC